MFIVNYLVTMDFVLLVSVGKDTKSSSMRAGVVVGVIIGVIFVIVVIMAFIVVCSRKRVITNRERERDHLVRNPKKVGESKICAN